MYAVHKTSDGGYILTGRLDGANDVDAWLIKTDANGSEQWNRTFGGTGFDEASSVQETLDGGYILAGRTTSYGTSETNEYFPGIYDAWLIRQIQMERSSGTKHSERRIVIGWAAPFSRPLTAAMYLQAER